MDEYSLPASQPPACASIPPSSAFHEREANRHPPRRDGPAADQNACSTNLKPVFFLLAPFCKRHGNADMYCCNALRSSPASSAFLCPSSSFSCHTFVSLVWHQHRSSKSTWLGIIGVTDSHSSNSKPAHGRHMVNTWLKLDNTWSTHGQHMVNTWPKLANTWSTHGRHMVNAMGGQHVYQHV